MTTTPATKEKEKQKEHKENNIVWESIYNIVAWIPTIIISWIVSNIDP